MLFRSEKYNFIYNRNRYLTEVKSSITYAIAHNCAKIIVDLYDSLPLEKTMTFHNVIKLIKSLYNIDKNNYYCYIFLEKTSYELPKKLIFI